MKLRFAVMTPALLALSGGAAFAVPPTGFSYDDYTVDTGTITAGCPVGYTCTTLDATGNGILQQRVTDGADSFFRTIVVNEGVTATDLASVEALAFRDESYINAADGEADMSARGIIQGNLLGAGVDDMYVMAEITDGSLSVGGAVRLEQFNQLGAANRSNTFVGVGGSNNLNMQLNVLQPNNEGQMTIRKATAAAAGNLSLTDADPGIAPLAYAAGNRLQLVWLEQAASGTGDAFNRILGQQSYTNLTTSESIQYNNGDGAGNFIATNNGVGNDIGGIGPWNWDASLFGTEPNPYVTNADNNGATAPAVTFP
ncbi:MAG: hypothetical protein RBT81_06960 [Gammaproteobacteria bacterium]|jgi:hypothetical protein|nr:hypothetical protein [Gammaproteobacteria bacterium]